MAIIIGAAFPLPKIFNSRFFNSGKTVFIKPASLFKKLTPGMKFIFYQSYEDTGFVGEATIERIIFDENPLNFFNHYKNEIFLTENETENYLLDQKKWIYTPVRKQDPNQKSKKRKKWMAIELKSIIKYSQVKKIKKFIPVGGQYIYELNWNNSDVS